MAAALRKDERIRIRLRATDHRLIDEAALKIVRTAKRSGATVCGPVPLPNRVERFVILKSPHVNKDARDQLEIRTHRRTIDIMRPDSQTVDALMRLNLAAGVNVEISVEEL